MFQTDPGDDPGSQIGHAGAPARPHNAIAYLQVMPVGGRIIRPGVVAWGGTPDLTPGRSCEGVERALAAVARNPGALPALLIQLAAARLWVPVPDRRRDPGQARVPGSPGNPGWQSPLTDGAAIRLPLVSYRGTDFVPCFTSVPRLAAWTGRAGKLRAGDARSRPLIPRIAVPAAGLARRLPPGFGIALNPDSVPGIPLYPECVPYLGELAATGRADPDVVDAWVACNASRLYSDD